LILETEALMSRRKYYFSQKALAAPKPEDLGDFPGALLPFSSGAVFVHGAGFL
jgi:hypothetical protein